MDALELLMQGFAVALIPENLLAVLAGVLIGQMVGILPGIGPAMGMVLLLPVTYAMSAVAGVMMLSGIMYGAMFGSTITSVLINIPGDSSSVVTAIEGNKLARKGRAGAALSIAAVASFIGGVCSVIALVFAAVSISQFALMFSAPEFFMLALLGLLAAASLGDGSTTKALIAGAFGLILALVGADPITGTSRLTFGMSELIEGVYFLPVSIGIFGIAELLVALEPKLKIDPIRMKLRDLWPRATDWLFCRAAVVRGSVLGFILGVLPGVGPTAASFMAYALERRFTKKPEDFGNGAIDAVAACEASNSACTTGALVPMLTLGIPGSTMTAVILAALTIQGISPGPLLMANQPDLFWGLVASMLIGNLVLLIMNLPLAPFFAMLLKIPYAYLAPGILLLAVTGTYAATLSLFTVGLALIFGVVGYFMIKANIPRAPLILALVLGPIMESSLRQALMMSRGSLSIFIDRPLSAVLLVCSIAFLLGPIVTALAGRLRARG